MIQWHLFNEWSAIFAKVPPLKYLKLITTLYTHTQLYTSVSLKTFEDRHKYQHNVKMDLREVCCEDFELIQIRVKSWAYAFIQLAHNEGEFLLVAQGWS
jgi:hypothetical protein